METGLLLQYLLIALAVVASAAYVLNRQLPAFTRRLRVACAVPMVRERRPGWMRALGRWIAPRATGAAGACGGCDGCGPAD
ncbi:hypothetical protein L3V18_03095 [Lysobacter sp. TLK-CK17T]|uniref:FeoB-associated Cys-rich membrane protein n=2 Tax=Marilutibacter chinensis TaxID=2912247 RepID=A0ABS9HQ55_9GAMM|nr:DUF6587 family protein [Lysobacter chinensis]MCF7220778.1 hypothetical protein [Lysobacter chinensis]